MSDQSPKPEPVVEVRDLVKSFGNTTVLKGISLDVYPGETVVVMGGSGCGKSTSLRCMIGSLEPDSGSIKLFGEDIVTMSERELNETRKKFGILFQSGALFNSMTLAENVALPLTEHTTLNSSIIDIQVKMKLELVGLREHANKYPAEISGGMKKRAGLARALALDPRLLFYDEPSAGLDPVTSAEIDRLIIDLSKKLGVASVVVTHEMDSAFAIADRMVMLDKGKVLMTNTRQWFDDLRQLPEEEAMKRSVEDRLIRQFLRGDAHGPITERKAATSYEEDLLGTEFVQPVIGSGVEPTRA
ncbi:MAG: ABC transporter ATP-binding protein [Phycisphaeraceae bacterium]|nr:ABC transporter ATP-binding protein [Phycisphaerales bacterium]MCB9860246.1 ABC transporter ATP-binding protein [Phycisphaeraceae bacterium]